MLSFKARLFNGMISGVGAHGLRLALNLLLIPLLIASLGPSDYGFYLILLNFSELILVLDGGITTGLTHRLSHALAQGDRAALGAQFALGQRLYLGLGGTLALVGFCAMPWLIPTFHLSGAHLAIAPLCLALTILDGALNLTSCYFNAVIKAHCLHQLTHGAVGAHGIVVNVASVLLVMSGFGLVDILSVRLLASMLKIAWLATQVWRVEPEALCWGRTFSWHAFGALFAISASALTQRISAFLAHRTASFLIAAFLGLTSVAIFGVVERIFGQITQLCLMLSDGLFPAFTRLSSASEAEKSRFFFLRMSTLLHFMAALPTLAVALFYPQVFAFLSGGTLAMAPTIPLACLLGLVSWSIVMQLPASSFLFASGWHRFQTVSALLTALVNVTVCLVLVKPLGLLGVALGITLPHLIQHQAITIPLACRHLGVSLAAYGRTVYGGNMVPLLVAGCVFLAGRLLIDHSGAPPAWTIIGAGLAGSMLAGVLWLAFTASPAERALLAPLWHRVSPARRPQTSVASLL